MPNSLEALKARLAGRRPRITLDDLMVRAGRSAFAAGEGYPRPVARQFAGLKVMVENPAGSTRSGSGAGGKRWSVKLRNDYGYIARTKGADGEAVDVFLGPDEHAANVYVVHQNDPRGAYDEDKVVLGARSTGHARSIYLSNYDAKFGPRLLRSVTEIPAAKFRTMLSMGQPDGVRWCRKHRRCHAENAIFSAFDPHDHPRGGFPQNRGEFSPASLSTAPLAEFARTVQRVADEHPAGFGDNKVFVHHAYAAAHKLDPSLTPETFKRRLRAANTEGLLQLSRADLVSAFHPEDVSAASVNLTPGVDAAAPADVGHNEGHFIVAANRRRQEVMKPQAPAAAPASTPTDRAGRVRQGIAAPHEHTLAEYRERQAAPHGYATAPHDVRGTIDRAHCAKVAEAVAGDEPIHPDVLADYPDLAPLARQHYAAETLATFDDEDSGGEWITVGAKPGGDGKRHGGTPVHVGPKGKIDKGPKALEGKSIPQLKEESAEDKAAKQHPFYDQERGAPYALPPEEEPAQPQPGVAYRELSPGVWQPAAQQVPGSTPTADSAWQQKIGGLQPEASPTGTITNSLASPGGAIQPVDVARTGVGLQSLSVAGRESQPVPVARELDIATKTGRLALPFVGGKIDPHLIDAYKRQAGARGYDVGEFVVNPHTGTAEAQVTPQGPGQAPGQPAPVDTLSPWEMHAGDYAEARAQQAETAGQPVPPAEQIADEHAQHVTQAVNRGEEVPPHVLQQYPAAQGKSLLGKHKAEIERRQKAKDDRAKAAAAVNAAGEQHVRAKVAEARKNAWAIDPAERQQHLADVEAKARGEVAQQQAATPADSGLSGHIGHENQTVVPEAPSSAPASAAKAPPPAGAAPTASEPKKGDYFLRTGGNGPKLLQYAGKSRDGTPLVQGVGRGEREVFDPKTMVAHDPGEFEKGQMVSLPRYGSNDHPDGRGKVFSKNSDGSYDVVTGTGRLLTTPKHEMIGDAPAQPTVSGAVSKATEQPPASPVEQLKAKVAENRQAKAQGVDPAKLHERVGQLKAQGMSVERAVVEARKQLGYAPTEAAPKPGPKAWQLPENRPQEAPAPTPAEAPATPVAPPEKPLTSVQKVLARRKAKAQQQEQTNEPQSSAAPPGAVAAAAVPAPAAVEPARPEPTPAAPTASPEQALKGMTRPSPIPGMGGQAMPDPVAQEILRSPHAKDILDAIPHGSTPLTGGAASVVLNHPNGKDVVRVGPTADRPNIPEVLQPTHRKDAGGYMVETLPRVETKGITDADVQTMGQQLKAKGYELTDPGTDNLGRTPDGRLVVIDAGAVAKAATQAQPEVAPQPSQPAGGVVTPPSAAPASEPASMTTEATQPPAESSAPLDLAGDQYALPGTGQDVANLQRTEALAHRLHRHDPALSPDGAHALAKHLQQAVPAAAEKVRSRDSDWWSQSTPGERASAVADEVVEKYDPDNLSKSDSAPHEVIADLVRDEMAKPAATPPDVAAHLERQREQKPASPAGDEARSAYENILGDTLNEKAAQQKAADATPAPAEPETSGPFFPNRPMSRRGERERRKSGGLTVPQVPPELHDEIRAAGGEWDAKGKQWLMPDAASAAAFRERATQQPAETPAAPQPAAPAQPPIVPPEREEALQQTIEQNRAAGKPSAAVVAATAQLRRAEADGDPLKVKAARAKLEALNAGKGLAGALAAADEATAPSHPVNPPVSAPVPSGTNDAEEPDMTYERRAELERKAGERRAAAKMGEREPGRSVVTGEKPAAPHIPGYQLKPVEAGGKVVGYNLVNGKTGRVVRTIQGGDEAAARQQLEEANRAIGIAVPPSEPPAAPEVASAGEEPEQSPQPAATENAPAAPTQPKGNLPVLNWGKPAHPTTLTGGSAEDGAYLKTIRGHVGGARFHREAVEVGRIAQPYGHDVPVYAYRGKLVRLGQPPSAFSNDRPLHLVDPKAIGEHMTWSGSKLAQQYKSASESAAAPPPSPVDQLKGKIEANQAAGPAVTADYKQGWHAKKNQPTHVVSLKDRVDREHYNALLTKAKGLGGYYSSFKGQGAIPGFQFPNREAAERFHQHVTGGGQPQPAEPTVAPESTPAPDIDDAVQQLKDLNAIGGDVYRGFKQRLYKARDQATVAAVLSEARQKSKITGDALDQIDGLASTLGAANHLRFRDRVREAKDQATVEKVLADARQKSEDIETAEKEAAVARANELQPTHTVTAGIKQGFEGNALAEGRYVSDGKMMVDGSALKEGNRKTLAGKQPKREKAHEGKGIPQGDAEKLWKQETEHATIPLTELGTHVPSNGTMEGPDGDTPVTYLATPDGGHVGVNAHKLAYLKKLTGADEIRSPGKPTKPVTLFKGGKPVAVLMPMDVGGHGIDVDTARQRAATFPPPPATPVEALKQKIRKNRGEPEATTPTEASPAETLKAAQDSGHLHVVPVGGNEPAPAATEQPQPATAPANRKGRPFVLPHTRAEIGAMSDEDLRQFRDLHRQRGYGDLVDAANEELARRGTAPTPAAEQPRQFPGEKWPRGARVTVQYPDGPKTGTYVGDIAGEGGSRPQVKLDGGDTVEPHPDYVKGPEGAALEPLHNEAVHNLIRRNIPKPYAATEDDVGRLKHAAGEHWPQVRGQMVRSGWLPGNSPLAQKLHDEENGKSAPSPADTQQAAEEQPEGRKATVGEYEAAKRQYEGKKVMTDEGPGTVSIVHHGRDSRLGLNAVVELDRKPGEPPQSIRRHLNDLTPAPKQMIDRSGQSLKVGDKVHTGGGLAGTIASVNPDGTVNLTGYSGTDRENHDPGDLRKSRPEVGQSAPSPVESLKSKIADTAAEKELHDAQRREAVKEKLAPEQPPTEDKASPRETSAASKTADAVAAHLAQAGDRPMSFRDLYDHAKAAGMGSLAEGETSSKDLYDAMELGVNRHVLNDKTVDPTAPLEQAQAAAKRLEESLGRLPTQTWRTKEQERFQQFSTPPHYSFAAAWVANLKPGDTMLEPSAGTGSLAVYGLKAGAHTVANELSPRRAALLKDLGVQDVHQENAEQIGKILHGRVKPNVVVMNPPFSQTAGRMGDKKVLGTAARHIDEAMDLLPENGRLVAIVGRGMNPEAPTFKRWFGKIGENYNLRANVGVSGDVYKKYGTSFGTRLLVIDKNKPTGAPPVTGDANDVVDLMGKLQGVRDERAYGTHPGEQSAGQPSLQGQAAGGQGTPGLDRPVPAATGDVGAGAVGRGAADRGDEVRGGPTAGRPAAIQQTGAGTAGVLPQPGAAGGRGGEPAGQVAGGRGELPAGGSDSGSGLTAQQESADSIIEGVEAAGGPAKIRDYLAGQSVEDLRAAAARPYAKRSTAGAYIDNELKRRESAAQQTDRESSKLPPEASAELKGDLDQVREHGARNRAEIERARGLDQKFGGEGRYEHETRQKLNQSPRALENIEKFRKTAGDKGIDFDKVLAEHGGLPEHMPEESPDARAWREDQERKSAPAATPVDALKDKIAQNREAASPATISAKPESPEPKPDTPAEESAREANPGVIPSDAKDEGRKELGTSTFEAYKPPHPILPGAKPHPTKLVESAAMSAVVPPKPAYKPNLPEHLIKNGILSDAQLEPIAYAGQAHSEMLDARDADGNPTQVRKGFFVGDGTGVGKGRIAAGILHDNWNQGRKKAVWISKNFKLHQDATRDWTALGGDPKHLLRQDKVKLGATMTAPEGVLFTGYGTLKTKLNDPAKSRLKQIADWLGPDFDGPIVFDESHMMKGAMPVKGKRGSTKASDTAMAGIQIQKMLPKARVVYLSATGATEVSNLGYAQRAGLWGPGTEFATGEDFASEVAAGGVSGMELVAQSMKQQGSYLARQLSYDGVTQERLTHTLTPDQRAAYDKLAEGWQHTLRNIDRALELTAGREKKNGEIAVDGKAKSDAYSAFWGANQRFFNQVITSMQMPSVLKDIEKELAAGKSAVVQLVNTNQASQERALAKLEGDDENELEELDITPRDQLLQLVQHSFPVEQHEEYTDEEGNVRMRPVKDAKGDPVLNPEAVAMRDKLLSELASVRVPDGPLEMLHNHFGHENVAEVTGRTRRVVRVKKNGGESMEVQPWGEHKSLADANAFQGGKKRILVFSNAGGTGASYHADKGAANQQQRAHYLVQPGWVADNAVQGFGRTHRSGEVNQPVYKLVQTDLNGQKRFISSIARKLDQLGALTRGQRDAASGGMFDELDNLESPHAQDALKRFVEDLDKGAIPDLSLKDFERQTGLKLSKEDKSGRRLDVPQIPQFLNRLLSMNIDSQNTVFDHFMDRFKDALEAAKSTGQLDTGMETVRADSITKKAETTVYTDPKSGAQTKHVTFAVKTKTKPNTFAAVAGDKKPTQFYLNKETGKVYAFQDGPNRTNTTNGKIESTYRRITPARRDLIKTYEFTPWNKDKWEELDNPTAERHWSEQLAEVPSHRTEDMHLLTGAILPIWKKVGGKPHVRRLQTDDGQKHLGRVVPENELEQTLKRLGIAASGPKLSADEAVASVHEQGKKLRLSGGWTVKPVHVAGEKRIEVIGPDYSHWDQLARAGAHVEKQGYQNRVFIPTGPRGAAVMEHILRMQPIESVSGGGSGDFAAKPAATFQAAPVARPQPRFATRRDEWSGSLDILERANRIAAAILN